jgi:hypothetical protein
MTADAISEGKAAWDRLKSRERATWSDWIKVGQALLIGRAAAMKAANTNRAVGTRYNKAMGQWLRDHGLDGINNQERYRAILCVENRDAIEVWRATLDDAKRRRFNHPNSVWAGWRKSKTEPAAPARYIVNAATPHKTGKPIFWSQDMIRRAAMAIKDARTNDYFLMARAALEGAVRDGDDLLALLENTPTRTPAKAAPADAVAPA